MAFVSRPAHCGAQAEELLADAVRTALSAAIASAAPPEAIQFDSTDAGWSGLRWLGVMSERLKRRKSEHSVRVEFPRETLWYETACGLGPELVLGLIQVESGFRRYAISVARARGYMQ